jgi:hypothetical protein
MPTNGQTNLPAKTEMGPSSHNLFIARTATLLASARVLFIIGPSAEIAQIHQTPLGTSWPINPRKSAK